jgi:hypothetical protein
VTLVLYFNELSVSSLSTTRHEAETALVEMSKALSKVSEVRSDIALCTPLPLNQIQLCPDYYLGQWAADSRYRDYFRRIQATLNHAPFVLPEVDSLVVEYRFEDQVCLGLGLAHAAGTSTLSLCTSDKWRSLTLTVAREALLEDSSLEHGAVEVRNISDRASVVSLRDWLQKYGFSERLNGTQIWEQRARLFPRLQFLNRVGADLAGLSEDRLSAVLERLTEMNEVVSGWDPAITNSPAWGSRVTPESESRKKICWFEDTDGVLRCFDLHARFTPRAGRIHFRLVASQRTITIAHIGDKL